MDIKQASVLMARIALFVIYFWFGFLKVINQSPASPLVHALFNKTIVHIPVISIMSFDLFIILFGLFEMFIGLLFIIPGKERLAMIVFGVHMFTTILPLFVMIGSPNSPWTHILVPTIEGQYIIKNLSLIACALTILASLPKKINPNVTVTNI